MSIARTPKPPYYAAIFSSVRSPGDDPAHDKMGERMVTLASEQPGFLCFEFGADMPERFGLFVSCWRDDSDIARWKQVGGHLQAQELGRSRWYESYTIRIAKVERDYGKDGG